VFAVISNLLEKVTVERMLAPVAWLIRSRLKHAGDGSYVSPFIQGIGLDCVTLGNRSRINRYSRILALKRHGGQRFSPSLEIGDDVNIGFGCVLSCVNRLTIGDRVLIADHVYIADSKHGYADLSRGVADQPLATGSVEIGYGAVIAGEITIGEHSIVAANSVVTKSVEPYTMVGGVPAKVLKRLPTRSDQADNRQSSSHG
jgi:acetyltransferase-like isoleucine patch superfamily enzyme